MAKILTHLTFSTKNREPRLVGNDLRQRTHAYLATVSKDTQCPALIVGGTADHVHVLCQLAKTQSISNIVEHLKASSSVIKRFVILAPLSGRVLGWRAPRVETLRVERVPQPRRNLKLDIWRMREIYAWEQTIHAFAAADCFVLGGKSWSFRLR